MTQAAADPIGVLVERLARPHASGGKVIERSVILAEGSNSPAILKWISDHDGVADSSSSSKRSHGIHGSRVDTPAQDSPARRFVLPARAFLRPPEDEDAAGHPPR